MRSWEGGEGDGMELMKEKKKKQGNQELWYNYTTARTKYVRISREERTSHEKDVDKCKEEPKLFFWYVNCKENKWIEIEEK